MFKLKLTKKNKSLILGSVLIFSSIAFAVLSGSQAPQPPEQNQNLPNNIGSWKGMQIYEKPTSSNQSIYYLEIQPGYNVLMRADPREAEKVSSPPSIFLYSTLYTSQTVYALFDPENASEVNIAYAELAKFLANRPFRFVFGTTSPYQDKFNRTFLSRDPFNTTMNETIIYLKVSNSTSIDLVNRTIIVNGKDRWGLTTATAKLELILLRLI